MSRICLVCMGTPGFIPSSRHHGPGKRAAHFARALVAAGHDVLVVAVDSEHLPRDATVVVGGARVRVLAVPWGEFADGRVARAVREFDAAAVVAATAHAGALAAQLDDELPLWVDVFGDLMAEAQAKAIAHDSDAAIGSFWGTLVPGLRRGDRFSAVSAAQADSLYGQLGVVGRLNAATVEHEFVSVIPCATDLPPEAPPRTGNRSFAGIELSADAFVVLWTGSFNTWCDVDTLFDGLERAMDESPRLHFVATGAQVPGHDERTYARFTRRVRASNHRSRYHLLGWLEESKLPEIYRAADLGVVVERDLLERRFGSENRVVEWLAHGLPSATTARSALGRELVRCGLAFEIPPGDAAALAELLVGLARDPARTAGLSARCRAHARDRHAYETTAAALVRWCAEPRRAGDRGAPPISVGLVSEPRTMVRLLEAYVAELSAGQLAFRSLRWAWRRLTTKIPFRARDSRGVIARG